MILINKMIKKVLIFILILFVLEGIAFSIIAYHNSSYFYQKKYMGITNKIKGEKIAIYNFDLGRCDKYKIKINSINDLKNKLAWNKYEYIDFNQIYQESIKNESYQQIIPNSGYYILFDKDSKKLKTLKELDLTSIHNSYLLAIISFEKEELYIINTNFI